MWKAATEKLLNLNIKYLSLKCSCNLRRSLPNIPLVIRHPTFFWYILLTDSQWNLYKKMSIFGFFQNETQWNPFPRSQLTS